MCVNDPCLPKLFTHLLPCCRLLHPSLQYLPYSDIGVAKCHASFGNGMLSTSHLGFDFSCLHPLTWYIYLPLATYIFASWPPGCSYIAFDAYNAGFTGYAYFFCRPRRYSSLAVAFMSMIVLAPCRLTIFPGCWCSIPYVATLGSSSLAVVFCCALFFASIHPVYSCHWLSSPGLCDAHGSSHLIPLLLLLTSPAMADTLSGSFQTPFFLFSVH